MEEQYTKVKKERIKTIAIIFLAVLLVLTFFSNTIMNHSLVEVSTEQIVGGSITTRVRGTGTVTTGDLYELKMKETRKIRTMNVKPGDIIEQGEIVFTLEDEESEELEAARKELVEAENAYNAAVVESHITSGERYEVETGSEAPLSNMQDAVTWANADLNGTKDELATVNQRIAELTAKMNSDDDDEDWEKTQRKIDDLNVEKSRLELAISQKETYLANVTNLYTKQVALEAKLDGIAEIKKKIEKLEAKVIDSEVEAPISGTVSSVDITAGNTAQADSTVLRIQPAGKGYELMITVARNLAEKVSKGDEANIVNNWWGDNIRAFVKNIRKNSADKNSMDIIFEIKGNVSAGESYTVSVGERSGNYDAVVPTSAVREDANGKYILLIETKSTPLGNRYYARRQNVEVITSDDTRSAVTGNYDWGQYVITTTSKPVKENDQVRLAN